jgi:hypothetical protein
VVNLDSVIVEDAAESQENPTAVVTKTLNAETVFHETMRAKDRLVADVEDSDAVVA